MKDNFGREIDYLRISLTDRCNLRCVYCMPEEGVPSMSHSQILTYEEILRLVRIAEELGFKKIRLTGGEPLVRKGIESLISEIHALPGIESISITTNGILLPEMLPDLKVAGLDSVNISLDTLRPDRFIEITRRPGLHKVIKAINMSVENGLNTKINCVAMKGVNDDEFVDLAALARDKNLCVRFIEYMPVGKHDYERAVSKDEVKLMLQSKFGPMIPDIKKHGNGPADYFKPEGFKGSIGFISAMTNCFCQECNRVRLTADGFLKLCLQYDIGVSLRDYMRKGCSDQEIKDVFLEALGKKPKEHTFNNYKDAENIEERSMSGIGG